MKHPSFQHLPHFFQPVCLLCHCSFSTSAKCNYFGLCHYCESSLPFLHNTCYQCAITLTNQQPLCGECIQTPPAFDSTCCALAYEGSIPSLIHRFKTKHNNALKRLLTELLAHSIPVSKREAIDCIIPVPMHWRRNLQRGNNHADLLAKALSRNMHIPLHTSALSRSHTSMSQKQLNAFQRKHNLQHAFHCSRAVTGLRIAVVDDVITTGSTMNAIATTLKNAGAKEVHCWAIARTLKHGAEEI